MSEAARLQDFKRGARRDLSIWAVLLALGALSFYAAFLKTGPFDFVINLALAAIQIALLGLFYMDLRKARPLIALTSTSAFLFVVVMFALTLNDLFTRV